MTSQLVKVQPKRTAPREFEGYKLERKTKGIKKEFARFIGELEQHLVAKDINVSAIKTEIIAYDRSLREDIQKSVSLHDILNVLIAKASFLDYDLIKLLIDHGDTKIKMMFTDYKRKLQGFLEERMIKEPSGGEDSYVVVIDQIITDECADLKQLLNRVKIILGHKNITLLRWENLRIPSTLPVTVTTVSEESLPSSNDTSLELQSNPSLSLQSDAPSTSLATSNRSVATLNNDTCLAGEYIINTL